MRFEFLDRSQTETIHLASLDILENAGATFLSIQAQRILADAGAIANGKNGNVRIPASLVQETLCKCPTSFRLYARNPKHDLQIGGSNQYMTCGGEYPYILDLESGKRRPALSSDLVPLIKITDALDNISVGGSYIIAPSDIPEPYRHIERSVLHYKYTSKTTHWDTEGYIGNSGELGATHNLELAATVAGGTENLSKKPIGTASICPSSPMIYDSGLTDDAIEFARHGVPILIEPMDNAGATSPNTLAGSLLQTNATVLAGLVLVQLVRPGNPVVYGSIPVNLDLRTIIPAVGCPETALRCAGGAEMAKFYGLPSAMSGGVSDSKVPDVQAGYESALTMLTTILAGANWIRVVAGALEYHFTASPEMLVIHDEIFGMAKRIARGMDVSEDTLATSLIKKIAPLRGHYLAEKHTLQHITSERYLPKISDKRTRGDWEKSGSRDLAKVARERAKQIIATHKPDPPLPKDIEKELDAKKMEIEKRLSRAT
ncbi:MAG: trimethylamine methyltransferase family protein [Candidatus Bathyarchaeia archaeon]